MSGHARERSEQIQYRRPRSTTTTSDPPRAMREQLQKRGGAGSSLRSSSLPASSLVAPTTAWNRASSAGP